LLDLKNEIVELKTKQMESQLEAQTKQQELLNQNQQNITAQLSSIMKIVNDNLNKSQQNINSQLNNTGAVIGEIQKKLGTLEVTAKNIQDIGKDISSLQSILQSPKLRGNLGEYLLEDLLKQIFPSNNYEMKYSFKNGTQVDAVIKLGEGIVPIDSKFPLESFQRLISTNNENEKKIFKKEFIKSVKDRIDEIADKYINQNEGTFDFAMMYIPAENVFYETIINDSLTTKDYEIFNYAIQKHIIPVSPNSFYAYLMALVYGLRGFKIEQEAKMIIGELGKVQNAFQGFYSDFTLIGKHISNASGSYDKSLKRAEKFNDKIGQISGIKTDLIESDPD
jgi:DNA recombination protein RmuC